MSRDPEELRRLAVQGSSESGKMYSMSSSALRAFAVPGEQERTSFRLTAAAADARDWLVDYLQIAQRELFDRIPFYLDEAIRTYEAEQLREVLSNLAMQGERKTYVVSDHALKRINVHADRLGVPRDALVSFALLGMQYLAEQTAETARDRRARFVNEIKHLAAEVRSLQQRVTEKLDPDDALHYRLASIGADLELLVTQLTTEQSGGPLLPYHH